jgi:hydroxymethylbilane synthase
MRAALNHRPSELAILAERSFLRKMEGGCSIPVFALCQSNAGVFHMQAGIISTDGKEEIRYRFELKPGADREEEDLTAAGEQLALQVLQAGGTSILQKIRSNCA